MSERYSPFRDMPSDSFALGGHFDPRAMLYDSGDYPDETQPLQFLTTAENLVGKQESTIPAKSGVVLEFPISQNPGKISTNL